MYGIDQTRGASECLELYRGGLDLINKLMGCVDVPSECAFEEFIKSRKKVADIFARTSPFLGVQFNGSVDLFFVQILDQDPLFEPIKGVLERLGTGGSVMNITRGHILPVAVQAMPLELSLPGYDDLEESTHSNPQDPSMSELYLPDYIDPPLEFPNFQMEAVPGVQEEDKDGRASLSVSQLPDTRLASDRIVEEIVPLHKEIQRLTRAIEKGCASFNFWQEEHAKSHYWQRPAEFARQEEHAKHYWQRPAEFVEAIQKKVLTPGECEREIQSIISLYESLYIMEANPGLNRGPLREQRCTVSRESMLLNKAFRALNQEEQKAVLQNVMQTWATKEPRVQLFYQRLLAFLLSDVWNLGKDRNRIHRGHTRPNIFVVLLPNDKEEIDSSTVSKEAFANFQIFKTQVSNDVIIMNFMIERTGEFLLKMHGCVFKYIKLGKYEFLSEILSWRKEIIDLYTQRISSFNPQAYPLFPKSLKDWLEFEEFGRWEGQLRGGLLRETSSDDLICIVEKGIDETSLIEILKACDPKNYPKSMEEKRQQKQQAGNDPKKPRGT